MTKSTMGPMFIQDFIQKANISRELLPTFHKFRKEAFHLAQEVFDNRAISYNVDHPCYEEQVYGPISLASEIYKRARRLAAIVTPVRKEVLRGEDINRILDICIDTINYLTWMYALVVISSGFEGHANADDSPDYIGTKGEVSKDVPF